MGYGVYVSRWDVQIVRTSTKSRETGSTSGRRIGQGDSLSFRFRREKMSVSDSCTLWKVYGGDVVVSRKAFQ